METRWTDSKSHFSLSPCQEIRWYFRITITFRVYYTVEKNKKIEKTQRRLFINPSLNVKIVLGNRLDRLLIPEILFIITSEEELMGLSDGSKRWFSYFTL